MSIYQTKVLSETIISRYKPTRLAIKELNGVLYFCKSTAADIEKYPGSGVVWKKRIKKYGKENIKTLWVSDWYHDAHEIQEIALQFSQENKIVESSQWANLKPEDGLDGGHPGDEAVKRTALKQIGVKHSAERNAAKSARQRGKKKSQQWLDKRIGAKRKPYKQQVQRVKPNKNKGILTGSRNVKIVYKIVQCPHCDKTGGSSAMGRWHFDNCKAITCQA